MSNSLQLTIRVLRVQSLFVTFLSADFHVTHSLIIHVTMEQSSLLMSARVHFLVSLLFLETSGDTSCFSPFLRNLYGAGVTSERQQRPEFSADLFRPTRKHSSALSISPWTSIIDTCLQFFSCCSLRPQVLMQMYATANHGRISMLS